MRMAGRFKGDVRIDGNFNIEPGAHLTGQVLAGIVVVGGELQGNIESAKRVDVQEGGVIVGDVKAGSITVAAGSRMRGHVEFGWEDEKVKVKPGLVAAAASHERRSGRRLRRDTHMSALQGGRPAEREYLSGLPAPSALQFLERGAADRESVSAMRIEGSIRHAARDESCEYCVVVSITNERGEKNCASSGRSRRAAARREAQIQLLGRLDAGCAARRSANGTDWRGAGTAERK